MAIRERGGYPLMTELGTQPSNHYLPRRKATPQSDLQQVVREANPLRTDGREPAKPALPLAADWEH